MPSQQGCRRLDRRVLSQRAAEEIWGYVFLSPWLIGFVVFTAGAMLFSLGLTFFRTDLLTGYNFVGPRQLHRRSSSDPYFGKSLR